SIFGLGIGLLCGMGFSYVISGGFQFDTTWSFIFIIAAVLVNIMIFLYAPSHTLNLLLKKPVAELISTDHSQDFIYLRKKTFMTRLISRLSRTSMFAYKNLMTKKHDYTRALIVIGTSFIVLGILFTSPFVVQASYRNYITGATGGNESGNVLVFGHEDVVSQIEYSYRSFYEAGAQHVIPDLLNSNYSFDPSLIETITSNALLEAIDARIVQFTTALELQGVEINNESSTPGYTIYGQDREGTVLSFGVDFNSVFNRWVAVQDLGGLVPGDSVLVGDSVAGLLFDNIYKQKIEVFNSSLKIIGVVLDPVYNGLSVYMKISKLRECATLGPGFYNCAFLTLDDAVAGDRDELVAQLRLELVAMYGANFTLLDLAPVFSAISASIESLSLLYGLLTCLFFVFSIIIQVEFSRLFIRSNLDDFKTMFALGVKKGKINKIILEEFFFVLIPSCMVAFGVTLIINSLFLIQEPVLPPLLIPIVIFLGLFGSMCAFIWLVNKYRLKHMSKVDRE
nr:hypothetical protein [Candidatus Sigynarchaeota archaeon]